MSTVFLRWRDPWVAAFFWIEARRERPALHNRLGHGNIRNIYFGVATGRGRA